MTPHEFIQKWQAVALSERSACQQHFLDLCDLLGQPKPAAADPAGTWYTFERGVSKTDGGQGWADVWLRNHFGWEYKGKHKDLAAAYKQLLQYREDLENPPLLIVCDLDRFEIHTNFTGTAKVVHRFSLADLAAPSALDLLRRAFTDAESFRPGQTTESVTAQAAEKIGQIADGMRQRGIPAHDAAHFLMKLMFSMFAEDIGLLRNRAFKQIIAAAVKPGAVNAVKKFSQLVGQLFDAMAHGGTFGADDVLHFNGGLFADAKTFDLTLEEIKTLEFVNSLDWSSVEPSVFGTLFERILDPDKRSQIGAHYTSRADIETLLQPVVMQPLRREWDAVKTECDALWIKVQESSRKTSGSKRSTAAPKQSAAGKKLEQQLRDFTHRLEDVTILDPACGSGNFLYVALNLLLDLNKEVISYAAQRGVTVFPSVRPTQLLGIEINEYAQELASVVIWIGYLQWMHDNGFTPQLDPVLEPFESIRRMDAILDLSDPEHPREPEWPEAEFVVGNPPFLGDKKMRRALGDDYTEALRRLYKGRLPGKSDLCCYWFEKARRHIQSSESKRAGLLGTQAIRGGGNRQVLEAIRSSGDIFFAVSDRDWILDGATVHVSMVGFDNGTETTRLLDNLAVASIFANLTSQVDVAIAKKLPSNRGKGFMGCTPSGPFEITDERAIAMLSSPNPDTRPNSNVIRPWLIGDDITDRYRYEWIIDLNECQDETDAARYELPFAKVNTDVRTARMEYRTGGSDIWKYERARPKMRSAIASQNRYLATSMVSKHLFFIWVPAIYLPANLVISFASEDDSFFGLMHSRVHAVWANEMGTQLRDAESGGRYTHTTCFETFPFPEPTHAQRASIAAAAKELDTLRNNWLNPPEWTRTEILEFPGSPTGPWKRYISDLPLPPGEGRGEGALKAPSPKSPAPSIALVRYPRIVPRDEDCATHLKKRTLTNLYNDRPTWLALAHQTLDAAVFAAYNWDPAMTDDALLAALLALNLERAAAEP